MQHSSLVNSSSTAAESHLTLSFKKYSKEMSRKPLIVVMVSGNGSNLQAILDAIADGKRETLKNAQVALVVSNRSAAYGLERARKAGIPTLVKTLKSYKDQGKSRIQYDIDLSHEIHQLILQSHGRDQPDLVVLAGFMHILSPEFLSGFDAGRVINLHPALPGAFDGAHAIDRAFNAFTDKLIAETGVMVHRVIPEVDRGDVIVQQTVPILNTDTLESLEARIHSVEHELIVKGVELMLSK